MIEYILAIRGPFKRAEFLRIEPRKTSRGKRYKTFRWINDREKATGFRSYSQARAARKIFYLGSRWMLTVEERIKVLL